jgi:hypothetical protein
MAGPSLNMRVSDGEVLYEPSQESEYCDISPSKYSSDGETGVKILLCGERIYHF